MTATMTARNEVLVGLVDSGLWTTGEVAALAGITGQRVRQIAKRAGVDKRRGNTSADPIAILRNVRNPATDSWKAVVRGMRAREASAKKCLDALGLLPAVERLLRLRWSRRSAHGTPYRYNLGCRCDQCRKALARRMHLSSRRAREKGLQPRSHGSTGYSYYGCRCDVCRAANKRISAEWRERRRLARTAVTP